MLSHGSETQERSELKIQIWESLAFSWYFKPLEEMGWGGEEICKVTRLESPT